MEIAIRNFNGNGRRIERFLSNDQRESLVPAAAVIPASVAYIKIVAVKTSVVCTSSQTHCSLPFS